MTFSSRIYWGTHHEPVSRLLTKLAWNPDTLTPEDRREARDLIIGAARMGGPGADVDEVKARRPEPPTREPDETVREARRMAKAGWTVTEIAHQLGLGRAVVRGWVERGHRRAA